MSSSKPRVFGLEMLHMVDADVLPYDYATYAKEIAEYLSAAKTKAQDFGLTLDTTAADAAARKMLSAADAVHAKQASAPAAGDAALNTMSRTQYQYTLEDPGCG